MSKPVYLGHTVPYWPGSLKPDPCYENPPTARPLKYWEIVGDKLSAAGFTWGYCSAVTRHGWRYFVDAYRGDGSRYIAESDELLSAFLELESLLL